MNLICFPYAGGSSLIYKNWQSFFNDDVNVISYELAGRGKRITEKPYDSIDEAIQEVFDNLKHVLENESYSLFGHSMGASIVYKLMEKIREFAYPKPIHVFLSGAEPPHLKFNKEKIHLLPREKFLNILKCYNKTPNEFFHDKDLLDFYIPRLRSDFKLASTFLVSEEYIIPFTYDITCFYGNSDNFSECKEIMEWKKYTTGIFKSYSISGSHFFIDENPNEIVKRIYEVLKF